MLDSMKREMEQLQAQLRILYKKHMPGWRQSEQVLLLIEPIRQQFQQRIMSYVFASEKEEIYYFKHLKPQLFSLFIYHQKILHLELNLPKGSSKQVKKYYHRELKKVTAFFTFNNAFIHYLRSGSTTIDAFYFLRRQVDYHHISESFYVEMDPNCTTYYDVKASRLYAYERLDEYIKEKLQQLKKQTSLSLESNRMLETNTQIVDSPLPKKEHLLKSHQVERLLGISTSTLRKLRNNGSIPFVKIGGTFFYNQAEILQSFGNNREKG